MATASLDAGTGVADCDPTLVEDSDDDADGIANADDCNVSDATQMYDTDGDGICNSVDDDDDGDGVADWYDDYLLDADAQYNADGDAFNNTADADDDNDGVTDDLDDDDDGDGYDDTIDWAPGDPDEWIDTDGDGLGDNYDTDDDDDGVLDGADGCPTDGGASSTRMAMGCAMRPWTTMTTTMECLDTDDAFRLDPDASADFDGDGKADTLNPNLPTVDAYTTDTTAIGDMGGQTVSFSVLSCSFTLPAGMTLDITMNTYGWAGEAGLLMQNPSGSVVNLESSVGAFAQLPDIHMGLQHGRGLHPPDNRRAMATVARACPRLHVPVWISRGPSHTGWH